MNTDQADFTPTLPVIVVVAISVLVFFPIIAAVVAPPGRRGTFFLLTLFVLPGPFGVACAAVAQSRVYARLTPALEPRAPLAAPGPASTPTASQPKPGASPKRQTEFTPGRWGLDWTNPWKH